MARSPRTRFAAPFVVVVTAAGGCSDGKQSGGTTKPDPKPESQMSWRVRRTPDGCQADQNIKCPPPDVATCNPPAPMAMPCPPEATGDSFLVVSADGKSCFLEGGTIAVTCPSYDYRPPPPAVDAGVVAAAMRRWDIQRGKADCFAADDPCTRMQRKPGDPIPPCNPPEPIKIACPPEHVIAIVETAKDTCETHSEAKCDPGVKCNPPSPAKVECPRY